MKCKYPQDFVNDQMEQFHHQYLSESQYDLFSNLVCVKIMGDACKSPMILACCLIGSIILEMANLQKFCNLTKKGYFHLNPNIGASFPL